MSAVKKEPGTLQRFLDPQSWTRLKPTSTPAKRTGKRRSRRRVLSMEYHPVDDVLISSCHSRVAQLRMADTEMSELELWADFTAKMKDGIVSSFDQNVLTFEEDIRRLDSQRQMPGWNYCTFFILKEGLTHAYEMMNLHEEALRQYDELEASFFQILRGIDSCQYINVTWLMESCTDPHLFLRQCPNLVWQVWWNARRRRRCQPLGYQPKTISGFNHAKHHFSVRFQDISLWTTVQPAIST